MTRGENSKFATKLSSRRRKHPENLHDSDVVVEPRKRRVDFDIDILDCPICLGRLYRPVYQCRNGHTACSACINKFQKKKCPQCQIPIGDIRCLAIEKILDSLQVNCKYSEYGCTEMLNTDFELTDHEENCCSFKPIPCPSPDCIYQGSHAMLAIHLAEKHSARTVLLNDSCKARFTMEVDTKFTLLKGANEHDPVFLVHREAHHPLGDVFYCTALHDYFKMHYYLKVGISSSSYSMTGGVVTDLRNCEKEYWKHSFLLLPSLGIFANWQVDVHFSVPSVKNVVQDSNNN